jgi:hypothetical protein
MSAGRIVLLIFGIIFLLVALAMIVGGGAILAFENSFKDAEGFYTLNSIPVQVNSSAVTTSPADINIGSNWFSNRPTPIAIKIEATSSYPAKPIFIGVARSSDLSNYLSGVSYDEVTGFRANPNRLEFRNFSGSASPAPPATQTFWVASTSGTGTQTLRWDVTSGSYSVALMNADGSAPIDSDVSVGVRLPQVVHAIGLGLLIAGIVILIAGGVMVFFAAKGW